MNIKAVKLIFAAALVAVTLANAQEKNAWKNKKCAISLTYDDALNVHLDKAIPALDSVGLKGTFYLTCSSDVVANRLAEWRQAATKGHELANHTLFHPCIGKIPGREWVSPERDLSTYTVQRMTDEVKMTNAYLKAIDGKTKRTFAFTCGDTKIGDVNFFEQLKPEFVAARGVQNEMPKIYEIDLYNIGAYGVNGQSGEQMIDWVKKAMENNSLLVFLFHGLGGEHSLNVNLGEHRKLLQFLKQNENQIWVAPLLDIAEYVKEKQKANKNNK